MQIVKNCWNAIETFNCQYGALLFDGSSASIYVNHWLAPDQYLIDRFSRRNEDGFVGHCLLVFVGVRRCLREVRTHCCVDGEVVWSHPVRSEYEGDFSGGTETFSFEGSLQGFSSHVKWEVEASEFELHILDRDEPAREA
ncbi:hypothetical protein [Hydrogenophaga sp. 5NK40-0174]|uniref:hypothetical protein n=1 Tax=Hydrogenophaga sp. 5NK40-0174 TaxID=3127649 RepID=UPI00333F0AEA